ncbi:hypothetical protein [Dyella humicola]|uniref:hypothetical protein n=1 Tax=Dyella humicola TaxID=2992126 RepID=UPI0022545873|nr:hypothetical protein [Dyella humicola]
MSSNARVYRSPMVFPLMLAGIIGLTVVSTCCAREVRGGARTSVNAGGNRNIGEGANRNVNAGGNRNINANANANANVNRNANVNVNRNANVNVNRNIDVNADNNWDRGMGGCCYHPVATAAAVTATAVVTAAVVGSIVNSVPSTGCQSVVVNGNGYTQCGSTWYQPQYAGTQVTYVVVNPPG